MASKFQLVVYMTGVHGINQGKIVQIVQRNTWNQARMLI